MTPYTLVAEWKKSVMSQCPFKPKQHKCVCCTHVHYVVHMCVWCTQCVYDTSAYGFPHPDIFFFNLSSFSTKFSGLGLIKVKPSGLVFHGIAFPNLEA